MEKYIIGIEIGSSKVRGAVGVVDESGGVDVIAIEEERVKESVRYGCIQNMDVANAVSMVCERLEGYPRVDSRKIKGAYVAVGARSLMSRQSDVAIGLPSEMEITTDIVDELRKKASSTESTERDVVDVTPVRFTVDKKQASNPVGMWGQNIGAKMTVLSCVPNVKRMLRRVISEKLGLEILGFVPRPLAEAALVLTEDERRLGCMLVDFGAETTTVAIYKNGVPLYVATLPLGSRNITLDLTHLNFTEERAEEIKKVSGNALAGEDGGYRGVGDGIDYAQVNHYVHARCGEIIANIMAQVEYAGMRAADIANGIVIIGGGARLRGFNELLDKQSGMKVRQGSPQGALRISDGSIHSVDNIDVISLLTAAARQGCESCVEEPQKAEAPVEDTSYGAMYGKEQAGTTDGQGKAAAPAAADEPQEEEAVDDPENDRPKKKSIFDKIREKLANMVNDPEDDDPFES